LSLPGGRLRSGPWKVAHVLRTQRTCLCFRNPGTAGYTCGGCATGGPVWGPVWGVCAKLAYGRDVLIVVAGDPTCGACATGGVGMDRFRFGRALWVGRAVRDRVCFGETVLV
jgi:hypothetical protein